MIDFFCGAGTLCATAKLLGMGSSIAVDKVKKVGARCAVYALDLTLERNQKLLESWLDSPLLAWIHLAPVCGTSSRARDIRRFDTDPKPLRSASEPEGLAGLSASDSKRVYLANLLYEYTTKIFHLASERGIVVTVENPSNSYYWLTKWVRDLMLTWAIFFADFQACMLGSSRNKWTKLVSNIPQIEKMRIACDGSHTHAPWGFTFDDAGKQVWATTTESQYPRKFCITLVQVVTEFLVEQGLLLKPLTLDDPRIDAVFVTQQSKISTGSQPKPSKLPPVVPEFSPVAVFFVESLADIPCALMSKLQKSIFAFTSEGLRAEIPQHSRFLRLSALSSDPCEKGESGGSVLMEPSKKRSKLVPEGFPQIKFEVAFGLPWSCESFISRAANAGHPILKHLGVPMELRDTLDRITSLSEKTVADYRVAWCRRWLKRASELESAETQDRQSRPKHVAEVTCSKRLLLLKEMLESIGYSDMSAVDLLREGSTLAGEIQKADIFDAQFKPCLITMEQLEAESVRRNEFVLNSTVSSGDMEVDEQIMVETEKELELGWAEGPFELSNLESGATISRRFALAQSNKTRMIDDFSISSVNDSCIVHNKIDLHMIDTF